MVRSRDPRPEIKHNRIEERTSPKTVKMHKAMIYPKAGAITGDQNITRNKLGGGNF